MSAIRSNSHKPFRGARALAFSVLVGVGVLASAVPASAASTTPFNANLVKNPGAEAGSASPDGQSGVNVPHWDGVSGSTFTVVKYGTPGGFPSHAKGQHISGGKQFFTTGAWDSVYGQCDDAKQSIFIHGRSSAIDHGHVKVVVSAYLATFSNQSDTAHLNLYFGDDSNNSLGGAHVKPQTATNDNFHHVTTSRVLPKRTREITIDLWASNVPTDQYCDAYFDNISVKIVPA